MDMRSWKKVLLHWITECGFMERNYFNIEQSDVDAFYENFRAKHQKTAGDKCKNLGDFLKEFYFGFDINFDDENCLSSADYIYVYSLLLHFCCVKYPETAFHQICQRLPDFDQQYIAGFFKELLDTDPITKEHVRHAIAELGNIQVTPPRLNDSFSSGITSVSVGGLSSASFSRCESPLKTPKRCAGSQRISPPTPKSYLLEERTKELYNLRAQLETERYEKGLLEVQIKQNEDEIQKLNNDHKRLLQQIQDLRNDILAKTSDGSSNCDDEDYQIQKRLLKELSQKEQELIRSSNDVRTLREEKVAVEKRLILAEKQIILFVNRIKESELKIEELSDELKEKNAHIKYLTDNKIELEQFIVNTRSASNGSNRDLNTSADCLDSSFFRSSNNSNGSTSLSSPENLGASVIDVKLREKEYENEVLKEELKNVQLEQKRLAKHLTKLTHEFGSMAGNTSSNNSSKDTEACNEQEQSEKESSFDDHEHFSMFNMCMEKIDKYHKTEKNKMKQLDEQSSRLQEDNANLSIKLSALTDEISELKENLAAKENIQQEISKSNEDMQLTIQKFQNDKLDVEKQNNKLYNEVQSLHLDKEKLNENLQQLKSKLQLQKQQSKEVIANNKKLKESEQGLKIKLKELDELSANKTLQWKEELKHLSERISKQVGDIEVYKQTEKTIKSNYEQVVIQNEELKKETRLANTHLCEMRNHLKEKERELALLGKEIGEFKQANNVLEKNICCLMEEHKQEMLTSNSVQTELDGQLLKLKDQLTKMELLRDSKQHECDLKLRHLEEIKIEVIKSLKLFIDANQSDDDKDVVNNIEDLRAHIKSGLKNIEKLTKELQGKSQECENMQEEIIKLKADNLAGKKKIEEIQQEKVSAFKKALRDVEIKEQELQDHLKEASLEYEASMERIAVELKLEKEHHNNKEMELILSRAEHNEAKKKLNEAEKEIAKLCQDKQQLQKSCERLKHFEARVIECSEENNKLRQEIETFKQQVTLNALRLLEADKALAEFVELTKEQDSAKNEMEALQTKLREKGKTLLEMEMKLQQQSLYEEQISQLKLQQEEQNEQVEILKKDKDRLVKENEEKAQQILKEQQDKLMLLTSLEKSTDQLKLATAENQQQKAYLEQNLQDLKEQCNILTSQNTKLQGDLIERTAELRLSLDELQQEKEDYQQKLNLQIKQLSEITEQLENTDMSLIEIVAIMENNFNLSQELLQENVNNVFNYCKDKSEKNIEKVKRQLNLVLHKQQQINDEVKELSAEKHDAIVSLTALKDSNNDLLAQLNQNEKTLKETQERLANEELIVEKRFFQEVKRLEEDLSNLEKVNERLANENVKIQIALGNAEQDFKDSKLHLKSLEDESLKLKEELRSKSEMTSKLQSNDKNLQNALKEKCQQIEKLSEKCKHFEVQMKDKTSKLQNVEKEYQEAKEKAHKNQQKLIHWQQSYQSQQVEQKKLQEKLKGLQATNDSLEMEVANKFKELLTVKNKSADLLQRHKDLEQQLNHTSQKLDEMLTTKLNAETRSEQLQSEVHQLKRDLDFTKLQHQAQQEDNNRLSQEIESLKVDKQHLRDEVHENKLNVQRANENVSQLIQQISSIRLEKEAALEENILLRKQLEETGKHQSSSETKMKSIIEKSQDLERKLLAAENELKSLKANLKKSECCSEKLETENKKLRESHDATTKRIEKFALKLGDSQAKSTKLERDNEKLGTTLQAHAATVEALQKEKDLLQNEAKSLKERLSRAERAHEQLAAKVQNLEHLNANLQQIKQKLETSEIDGKAKINKLEKMRIINEEKIRKLTNSLDNIENEKVKLNLEVGALNSQLKEVKVENNQENSHQKEELNYKLTEVQELNLKYEQINEKLKTDLNSLKEENSSLKDQLSKAFLSLQITSQKCERFAAEMEQIRADMLIIRQEKTEIELQHKNSVQKLNQLESQNTRLIYESKNPVKILEEKIKSLDEQLIVKTKRIFDLENEIKIFKENCESHTFGSQQNTVGDLEELEDLRTKLSLAEEIRLKEQEISSKLRLDNQILHTKYQESKQRALDAAKSSEERIKENRLELEGKLEKMKNKMKTLYTEEIAKMKTKQDREMAVVKSEMEVLKTQNTKYEEHTRKLSNQIVRLNDNILQHQKENTILSTKLKHMEQLQESERSNKRPNSIHVSTISSSTGPASGANIAPNLAMEDEEGEIFNNTYLTDLKNGLMPELMSRDVCVEELKYRNSLLPPHLRSAYAAQFDHELPEDDLKDGPHSFDDSMSALLSSTGGCTRKKCTGVTHYKRPGPPTPSKNGGRLSFGGISEPAREILKESYDINAGSAVSSSKTPARFNFFASRFSLSNNTKDEKPNWKGDTNEINLRQASEKKKIRSSSATRRLLANVGYTSTPRKSKVHYDQRRLLDQLMNSSPSPSPLTEDNKIVKKETDLTAPDLSIIETPLTTLDIHGVTKSSKQKMISKRLEAIAGGLKRSRRSSNMFGRRLSRRVQEICTPTTEETTSSGLSTPAVANNKTQRPVVASSSATTPASANKTILLKRRLRKKGKNDGDGVRPSLYLRGNIFAKYRTPKKAVIRDLNRYKSRKQRFEHFNKGRNIQFSCRKGRQDDEGEEEEVIDETISCKATKNVTYDLQNTKYATYNKNDSEQLPGETLIAKCSTKTQSFSPDTFTFGAEQFEQTNTVCAFQSMEAYESEEKYDCDDEAEGGSAKYELPARRETRELITSQDLADFDHFIANNKTEAKSENLFDNDHSVQGSSLHFEKLLVETDSSAPFAVEHMHFNANGKISNSGKSSNANHSSQSRIDEQTNLTTATPHISPIIQNSPLSRTIYGGTVIYNHRLPNINTTFVRKSSIYIKNRKRLSLNNLESSSCNDVVLITNQTITFVDIMRMWSQMDNSTRLIVSFAVLASFTTLLGLVISLCTRQ